MKTLIGFWACLLMSSLAAAQTATVELETEDDLEVPAAPGPTAPVPTAPAFPALSASEPATASGATTPPPAAAVLAPAQIDTSAGSVPTAVPAPSTTSTAVLAPLPPPAAEDPPVQPPFAEVSRTEPAAPVVSESWKPAPPALDFGVHAPRSALGLKLGGFVQAQYQLSQLSEDQLDSNSAPLNRNEFVLRRGRIRLDQGWQYAAATIELDANTVRGVDIGVRRAFASLLYRGPESSAATNEGYAEAPIAALTVGILDVPFGYEMVESPLSRAFMERSQASRALFPAESELGASLAVRFGYLRVNAALVNGEVSLKKGYAHDPNAAPELIVRLGGDTSQPGQDWSARVGVSFATGKGFHAGEPATKDTLQWVDANSDGVAAANEMLGVPGSAATRSQNFDRWVLGLDAGGWFESILGRTNLYAEVYLASNHDRGLVVADPIAAGRDVREAGLAAGLSHVVARYFFAGFQVGLYDSDSDVIVERRGELLGASQATWTWAPVLGAQLPGVARLSAEYNFISDHLARDAAGVPTDAKNNTFTVRLEARL